MNVARLQRLLTLAILLVTLLLAGWAWEAGRPLLVAAVLLLALSSHAFVLGCEFVMMRRVNRLDPAPAATWPALWRAWWREALHGPLVFCWRQPFRAARWPDATPPAARRGVLLVHGFLCNRGLWNRWREQLAAEGAPCVAVTLEPMFGSIDAYAETIDRAVDALQRATGQPPLIVAHSMGGLAVRHWWSTCGGDGRVAHVITLGTPHRGTWLARFAFSVNGRQMRLDGPWIRALSTREPPGRSAHFTCFYSPTDNIVFPTSAATLPGADNRLLDDGVPHVAMADDPRPWQEALRRLQA